MFDTPKQIFTVFEIANAIIFQNESYDNQTLMSSYQVGIFSTNIKNTWIEHFYDSMASSGNVSISMKCIYNFITYAYRRKYMVSLDSK